jgi:hypothetical protein
MELGNHAGSPDAETKGAWCHGVFYLEMVEQGKKEFFAFAGKGRLSTNFP